MKKILFSSILLAVYSVYALGQGSREQTTIVNVIEKTTVEKPQCVPGNAFGLDLGIGAKSLYQYEDYGYYQEIGFKGIPTFDLGFRFVHHFLPYFGVDFFKFNNKFSYKNGFEINYVDIDMEYVGYNAQLMTGVRGNSPAFAGCLSAYGAFRAGYGVNLDFFLGVPNYDDSYYGYYSEKDFTFLGYGFCFELEVGFNITRNLFVAYTYNRQNGTTYNVDYEDEEYSLKVNNHAFRIGFNFGR